MGFVYFYIAIFNGKIYIKIMKTYFQWTRIL